MNVNLLSNDKNVAIINEAEALQWSAKDFTMVEETCWVTGRPILICRSTPDWYCVISSQDSCSGNDL